MLFIFIATANGVRLLRGKVSVNDVIIIYHFSFFSSSFFYSNLWYSITLFHTLLFFFLDPTLLGLLRGDTSDWMYSFFSLNNTLSITFYSRVGSSVQSPPPPLFSFWYPQRQPHFVPSEEPVPAKQSPLLRADQLHEASSANLSVQLISTFSFCSSSLRGGSCFLELLSFLSPFSF